MNSKIKSILLCEDDVNLASVVIEYLRAHDFAVDHAKDGDEGLEALYRKSYDLCILDTSVPKQDALGLVQQLRDSGKQLPIILISDRSDKDDIIAGYKAGGDDYVLKPFSMDILICKIQAFLRRAQLDDANHETIFQVGNITFDAIQQTFGNAHLSTRENDLLLMLCRKANKQVDRSQILKSIWQTDNYFTARSLAVYVNHLRHIMSNVEGARIIAVHGKGYKLVTDTPLN